MHMPPGYSGGWTGMQAGQFCCPRRDMRRNLEKAGKPLKRQDHIGGPTGDRAGDQPQAQRHVNRSGDRNSEIRSANSGRLYSSWQCHQRAIKIAPPMCMNKWDGASTRAKTCSHRQMSMPKPVCPNMATVSALGPPRTETAQKQRAGLRKLDAQPSTAESVFPRARHGRSLPRSGELAFRDTYAASGPNREPGRIRRLRISLPARQWRLRDACGLSRLNDLLALWSQAHMPSCTRPPHRPRSTRPNQARLAPLAVTHRNNRTHCLWLEQFQIPAEYEWRAVASAV